MTRYRSWLAASVLQSDQASRLVASLVGEWSRDWIGTGAWRATGSWASADITLGDEWAALRQSDGVSILGNAKSMVKLARAILGTGEQPANSRDLKLMRRLAGAALDDFTDRLRSAGFRADDKPQGNGGETEWVIAIEGGGEGALKLLCSQECLAAVARQTFARTRLPALTARRSVGVDNLETHVGALLGRARLSIDALRSLEVGDVLVLDRPTADPLEMIVAGRPTRLRGNISDHHGQFALKLQDPT